MSSTDTLDVDPAGAAQRRDGEPARVRFEGVGKQFGDDWVLRDVDLTIPAGSIHGLIGPSGCGKTTTVRLALGYYGPDEGTVELSGADPVTRSLLERKAVGYLPQHPVLFEELTLWQNLNYHASLNGVSFRRRDRLRELLDLVGLTDDRQKRVSEASGGMKRRLALAATLVHDPSTLLLDEPTAGVDPILREELWAEFRRLRDLGTTLVITTQFVEEAAYCDEVAILARGGVQASAPPTELVAIAYGGRRFDVQFDRTVTGRILEALEEIDDVSTASGRSDRGARVTVTTTGQVANADDDSAAVVSAKISDRLAEDIGDVAVVSVAEVPVEWNDVFAQIVEQRRTDA